jgi:hypothetical protein
MDKNMETLKNRRKWKSSEIDNEREEEEKEESKF